MDHMHSIGLTFALIVAGTVTGASLGAQSSRDQALDALRSPDVERRREALQQISRAGFPDAAGAVAALAADPDDTIQLAALDTLITLLVSDPAQAGGGPRGAFEAGLEPARPVPSGAYEAVAAAMSDTHAQVRLHAAYTFAILATSKQGLVSDSAVVAARGALGEMLADSAHDVRLAAIGVAARVFRSSPHGPPPVPSPLPEPLIEGLIAAMNQSDLREQTAAMQALGHARETRALEALTERFSFHRAQGPRELAVAALDALARLAHPASSDMVRALASDPWAANGDPYTAVLFARERLLHDGSSETLKKVASDRRLGARARDYLAELGLVP
ncbi:MAG: hypothetical protein LC791_17250 [Acidobacteria bacterium]|nr:hypothetical protein [Acidobacteriota bacterium]